MLSGGKKSLRNDMAILGDLVNISWIFYMDSMIFYYVWIFSFFFFFFRCIRRVFRNNYLYYILNIVFYII